jgi:hypothetical protein
VHTVIFTVFCNCFREDTVKEFGFIEADIEESYVDENTRDSGTPDEVHPPPPPRPVNRTRSGRPVRPPKRILKDLKAGQEEEEAKADDEEEEEEEGEQPKLEMSFASPPPFMEYPRPPPAAASAAAPMGRRNFSRPEKYNCLVCGKMYLGSKKMARHLKVHKVFSAI